MSGSNLYMGTLDLLILQTLKLGALHGYAIGRWIRERSAGVLDVEEGALYPALRRLEKKGWIEGDWGESELGRRARFYQLTKKGWMALQTETARWQEHTAAVASILREVGA